MEKPRDDEWRVIEALLPNGWVEKAREAKAFQRARYLKHPRELLRLLLFHAVSNQGLRETAAKVKAAGVADISAVALFKRLRSSPAWLAWIARELCGAFREGTPAPAKYRPRAVDSTTIQEPASRGTGWRLHYTLDLMEAACDWHELTDAHGGETLTRVPVHPGDLLLGDRNFFTADGVGAVVGQRGEVVIRLRWCHPRLKDAEGNPVQALELTRRLGADQVGDWPVALPRRAEPPLPGRVVALKLPAPLAAKAVERLMKAARKKRKKPDPRSLEAAQYVMLFTTLPASEVAGTQVLDCYRFRWQIELAFKRHKQLLGLGRLPHKDPAAARGWILAKLVLALLLETLFRQAAVFSPWGYDIGKIG